MCQITPPPSLSLARSRPKCALNRTISCCTTTHWRLHGAHIIRSFLLFVSSLSRLWEEKRPPLLQMIPTTPHAHLVTRPVLAPSPPSMVLKMAWYRKSCRVRSNRSRLAGKRALSSNRYHRLPRRDYPREAKITIQTIGWTHVRPTYGPQMGRTRSSHRSTRTGRKRLNHERID